MTPKDKTVAQMAADISLSLGLKFIHIRHRDEKGFISPTGGATLAYKVRDKEHGGRVVDVSVALCNKKDVYNRAHGRLVAAANFKAGHHVNVRVAKRKAVTDTLYFMFRYF